MERQKNLKDKEKLNSIEGIRELFVDPTGERRPELSKLASIAADVMQQIYATGGNIEKMPEMTERWLKENAHGGSRDTNGTGSLEKVLGQILAREAGTRRFDHKFFGQIHPQGSQIGILANFIAAYMNTNTVYNGVSKAENLMEEESLDWMADMFGYDRNKFSGNIVTGGTEANETAFWVAREWAINQFHLKDSVSNGFKLYVVGSEAKHYSVVKACNKLGMTYVQIPEKGLKTDVMQMQKTLSELDYKTGRVALVLGIAGGTETGMIDNLEVLADIAERYGAHFHVDAAYGGPYILTKERFRFAGINRADSITMDPHKMLYTPYASGVVLFKDKNRHAIITSDFLNNAGYLENEEYRKAGTKMARGRSYGSSRSSGSMSSAGAISTWATMKLLGNEGIKTILDHTLKLTESAYERVNGSPVLFPLHKPELNTLLVGINNRTLTNEQNNFLVDQAINHAGERGYYISSDDEITHGRKIFRFLAMHPYSTENNVHELFDLLEESIQK